MTSLKVTSPKAKNPRGTSLKVTSQKVTSPKVTSPKVTSLKVTSPKAKNPRVTSLKVTSLKVTSPKVTSPKVTSLKVKLMKKLTLTQNSSSRMVTSLMKASVVIGKRKSLRDPLTSQRLSSPKHPLKCSPSGLVTDLRSVVSFSPVLTFRTIPALSEHLRDSISS